jgi:two-component system sensor histidine kinase RegB
MIVDSRFPKAGSAARVARPYSTPMRPPDESPPLALLWIVRLRYGVIAGEIALAVAFSVGLGITLPVWMIGAAIGFQTATNVLLGHWRDRLQRNAENIVGVLFCVDTLCLTLVLAVTGGPNNPFSLLYLVQITFSAVLLHRLWTWVLGIVSTLSFGLLFWVSTDIPALHAHGESGEFSLHLLGMWFAFGTAALLISFFVGKVSAERRQRESELRWTQERLARNERLASLVTLSAGAAHEMATPLSTIAVVAKEMERYAAGNLDKRVDEDARLIRSQVERCRLILERMGAQGADPLGETPKAAELLELLTCVQERFLADASRIRIDVDTRHSTSCVLPFRAAVEALSALVKNALDASEANKPVLLQARSENYRTVFVIRDEGAGMTPEIMQRVSEPFFTTKPPGKGMGLGAFLAHLFAQQLGGTLSYESQAGRGCTATMELPDASNVQS